MRYSQKYVARIPSVAFHLSDLQHPNNINSITGSAADAAQNFGRVARLNACKEHALDSSFFIYLAVDPEGSHWRCVDQPHRPHGPTVPFRLREVSFFNKPLCLFLLRLILFLVESLPACFRYILIATV